MAGYIPMAREKKYLLVGVGGLGSAAALWLAKNHAGELILADGDTVEVSNLPRQTLYSAADIGSYKCETAVHRLQQVFPGLKCTPRKIRADAENIEELIGEADVVLDCTDHAPSKFLIHDAAYLLEKPTVYAGAIAYETLVLGIYPQKSSCLRCLYPQLPSGPVKTAKEVGVLNAAAALGGLWEAKTAVELAENEASNGGSLFRYDFLSGRCLFTTIERDPDCPLCGKKPTIRSITDTKAEIARRWKD